MDLSLFYALHSLAGHWAWSDWGIVFLGDWYLYAVLAVFAYVAWRDYAGVTARAYPYLVALAAAFVARFGVAEIVRHFYERARPFTALSVPHLINDTAYSFPSGHTVFLFALGAVTHFFNKKLAYFIYISGLLIGLARVAGGVHYPSDILGGIVLGAITGVCVYLLAKKYILGLSA